MMPESGRVGPCAQEPPRQSIRSRGCGEKAGEWPHFDCGLLASGYAGAQRLPASLIRAGSSWASLPKTVSSTRRQYASTTLGLFADNALVTCISGPNPASVVVRLTIM